ncbi:MAG: glycosyltransferase family 2 protein [Bacteroidales bacterium]|nr:glycosyltransferase family 2 protein [Bacteroidales bacterium]
MKPHLFVAIPAMDELATLPNTLAAISRQVCMYPFSVFVCVNQPDEWWNIPEKKRVCEENQQLLRFLRNFKDFSINIIDKSSLGNGWQGKDIGVGMARKVLFDNILNVAQKEDVIISMDADTTFGVNYFQSIGNRFASAEKLNVISVPYYHDLVENDAANRSILRYEIYMRSFLINLFLIDSPYAFTAIGSAIALRTSALKKIGGITPMKSGEDFYLLQKLRKMDWVSNWNSEMVHPAARFSNRVFFGTGPAMIKGSEGNWESYPIYHHHLFEEIKKNYDLISRLYTEDVKTDFNTFLESQFKTNDLWSPLRKNAKNLERFVRGFHEKADGLRILQYLKVTQKEQNISDEVALTENLLFFFGKLPIFANCLSNMDDLTTDELNEIRNLLFDYEMQLRLEKEKFKTK